MQSEESLIKKVVTGDLSAFKQLISQHERLVIHMVGRIINNEEDIKDVSQEVFIKVYHNLNKFHFKAKLSTWIARIAYSTAINYVKKYNKQGVTEDIELKRQLVDYTTPEHLLHIKNEAEFVHNQVSKLPLQYRTVLTLYHLNEFSYQEIEEITGMPEGTVKSYLFRARKLLKERLARYYHR
ncbi:sigma-70 family RNA polymerase sigma factor [Mucilaginibacter robiniae]|uniref:Sigma-70 family RNA polymerase sigma factor n=1 Tax=Mucilaginibacter robiniae TaxID=2728022 RepID=A0A7L5E827_9SPHI|nr:sigma-70 family RNA polymerase sigma factor [Mucilaginibacter robiniae]QJD96496.1 sigma-70 family RNA polymerase sigma factor [Mucilaginibacter robiniae]